MKSLICLTLLAATAVAPIAYAQEAPSAKTELAQIDPAARDLLARTVARYQHFGSFESLIVWKIGAAGSGLKPRRLRVQMMINGHFVVGEEFPDKSWSKAICDGKNLIEFRSKFPKTYKRTSIKSPLYLRLAPQLEASLRSIGAEGPLISLMLTNDFGAAMLDTDLESVKIQDDGALKIVEIRNRVPQGFPDAGTTDSIQFWIDPQTLTLDHATVFSNAAEIFTESYEQTRFNPKFDPTIFRGVAPIGYKLVQDFPDETLIFAKPPQILSQ